MRNGVFNWSDGVEPEVSFFVASHYAPAVRIGLVWVLHVIVAGRVCFPYVNLDVFDRVALRVFDSAYDQTWLAGGVVSHVCAVRHVFSLVGVKGAEDGTFC